jgi:hypothetical protein
MRKCGPVAALPLSFVLGLVEDSGPLTSDELHALWSGAPATLDDSLTVLRDDGVIACTDGLWWRRECI